MESKAGNFGYNRSAMVQTDKHKMFTEWVNQYGDALYSWAYHKIDSEAIAQDLIQETFIAAYQNLETFKNVSSPKTWLFSILKNKIVDHFRLCLRTAPLATDTINESADFFDETDRWRKEKRPEPWNTSDVSILDDPEFSIVLTHCLGNLPVSWSACVQLKYLGEKQTEEICQELKITASNLWQILHRAKLQLRNCLEKNWFKA